jgi:hypothetical protein
MTQRIHLRRARACSLALGLTFAAASSLTTHTARSASASVKNVATQGERVDIRLRSLTTRASGKLTVEASEAGGRARLTALGLPDPQTVASGASTYVVWALSGGRIVRLGELQRDERGNGGLAFERPAEFERYGVIVTAETSAEVERPGDPVLTTRADEAAALYPAKTVVADERPAPVNDERPAATNVMPSPPPLIELTPNPRPRTRRVAGDFYSEVDEALTTNGGGRVLELEGETAAPRALGAARATTQRGRAYVRANFRGVPLPPAVGANVYVLWAVVPDGRIVYMGSLPVNEALNTAEVYVRVAGFDADDYTLLVTAEQQRPAAAPSGPRVLSPKTARLMVK